MGRGRRGVTNQCTTKSFNSCAKQREQDEKMVIFGLKKKNKPKKPGFEISEDFLAELRKMDQGLLAKKLLSSSSSIK